MRNTLQQSISRYSTDGSAIFGGRLWEELSHPEKTQGPIQPAVRLRHKKRYLDYSEFVDLNRYKDKHPNKCDWNKFTKDQIARLWKLAEDPYYPDRVDADRASVRTPYFL